MRSEALLEVEGRGVVVDVALVDGDVVERLFEVEDGVEVEFREESRREMWWALVS